jgi:hypothetical protein
MEGKSMKTWRVWCSYWCNGRFVDDIIYIQANSYDEAIAKARKYNPKYDSAQVIEDAKTI